jgi:hypothetical protein
MALIEGGRMNLPDDKRRESARERFRNILSAEKEGEAAQETRKPAVVNLPKVGAAEQAAANDAAPMPPTPPPSTAALATRGALPTFWTAGSILSLLANFILLMMVIGAWTGLAGLTPGGSGGALLGVYNSLEQLGQAHIRTTIPIQTTISLDASVPVKTSTNITLSHDVVMQGAHVTINTAFVNIDAPADVTLPAGTSLDVALDMTLPMQTSVPIAVDVPVDIALRDTDLHAAIQGLQDSLKPLVCAAAPGARLPDGTPICR